MMYIAYFLHSIKIAIKNLYLIVYLINNIWFTVFNMQNHC